MSAETISSSAGFHADTPSAIRLKTLGKQAKDDRHPADFVVAEQIIDCDRCPGRMVAIGLLFKARDEVAAATAGSWDQSRLHGIDAKVALCSSCGLREKPRVLIKSA